jgi:hypothetical protein
MRHLPIRTSIVVLVDQTILQRDFASALLNPAMPVPKDVKGTADKRYAIYRNNVTVGLVRAMEANFPAIRKLLGAEYFVGLAREFVQAHPPRSPLMFFYGDGFADFLQLQDDLVEYPYLADVARLEQKWRLSYHEQDAPCLSSDEIAGLNETQLSDLRLTSHPAFALLESPYAVHAIFKANRRDDDLEISSLNTPEYVVITRPQFNVETQTVSKGTYVFLSLLSEGQSLGEAADKAFEVDPDLDLAHCISTFLAAGAFQPLRNQG